MNLIIFGPPGAGKGTQSKFIVQKYNLFQVSTGEILRNEIKNKTALGLNISSLINSGSLSLLQSITMTRWLMLTCGAARPMPGASYIVAAMSSSSWRVPSVISATGSEACRKIGSGILIIGIILAVAGMSLRS